jgi:hypothetical protein
MLSSRAWNIALAEIGLCPPSYIMLSKYSNLPFMWLRSKSKFFMYLPKNSCKIKKEENEARTAFSKKGFTPEKLISIHSWNLLFSKAKRLILYQNPSFFSFFISHQKSFII